MKLTLRSPLWIRPEIVRPGGVFTVRLAETPPAAARVWLRRDSADQEAQVAVVSTDGARLSCVTPPDASEGVRDLVVRAGDAEEIEANAVWVVPRHDDPFTFIHTSDLHLVDACDGRLLDRRPLAEGLVRAINDLRPAFVLHTGDAVSRYGQNPRDVLPAALVLWQTAEFARIMRGLQAPLFLVPGNHDRAYSWCREAWRQHVTRDAGPTDYSFDYGQCHFTGLDGSVIYPEQPGGQTSAGLSPDRLLWLANDLGRAADSRRRFLFYHFDYLGQLPPLARDGRVDMVLFGHQSRGPGRAPGVEGCLVSHLSEAEAFRPVTVDGEAIRLGPARAYLDLGEPSPLDFRDIAGMNEGSGP
jgi:hypothetical protein